jgi:predicted dehydrogenase
VKTLRIGVVGAGHLGRIHARLLAGIESVQLVAVADPVPEACHLAAAEIGAEELHDFRDLVGRVDAVILATPTSTHHAVGMELLEHGVHLLVEKPLAATVAQAEELVWSAGWHGAVLQVGHVERFNPALEPVLGVVRPPRFIEAVRHGTYSFRSTDIGAVLDLMIHDLDLALWLADSPVREVTAFGWSVLGGHEDVARARVDFASGCVAQFSVSRVSRQATRQMEVWSPNGQVSIDFSTRRTTHIQRSSRVTEGQFAPERLNPAERQHLQQHFFDELLPTTELESPPNNALLEEQRDFVESIRLGRNPRVDGAAGLAAVQLAEQVLQAIAAHRWEQIAAETAHGAGPTILRGPHWVRLAEPAPELRRDAG